MGIIHGVMMSPHSHQPQSYNRAFAYAVGLNIVFVMVEASYGLLVNSLALVTHVARCDCLGS